MAQVAELSATARGEELRRQGIIIRTEELWKTYQMGDQTINACSGITFEIRKGEYVAIMGPSGSGKSTLMNLIGCLDTPTKGDYFINGALVSTMNDDQLAHIRNKEVGFVFQTFNLLPRATALHNVELPLIYAGIPADERIARAREALRQRVAIARALVTRPSILLADEPTGALDSATGEEIMGLFDRLHQAGNTIILVTHEHDIAMHAHRIVFLRDGKVERDEPVKK
jgi:putative ABC transport system ATP-binding protein